ncbi:hypothetical protein GMA19_01841 [Paenibacillus polymyxa E681]|nr:hypothetical protein PPE_01823 [Paenibacillus polymyxa E681]QNV56677.1 hypothetical protein GE561_01841 [Paenibacillus polymyxa E681]QNV61514.1 hypothetical protein GMA19_01841 [Paenibacillus polymyxa E681]
MFLVIFLIITLLLFIFLIYRIVKYKLKRYNRENLGISLFIVLILAGRIYTGTGDFNLKLLLIISTFLSSVLILTFLFGMIRKRNSNSKQ